MKSKENKLQNDLDNLDKDNGVKHNNYGRLVQTYNNESLISQEVAIIGFWDYATDDTL